jgi:hypothetical protein
MIQGTYAIFSILEEYLFFLLVDVADNGGGRMRYREILRVKQAIKASHNRNSRDILFLTVNAVVVANKRNTRNMQL